MDITTPFLDDKGDATVMHRRRSFPYGRWLHRVFAILSHVFMLCPLIVVAWLRFFKGAIPFFPSSGYTSGWSEKAFNNSAFVNGFLTSLQVAAMAAIFGVVAGATAALGIILYRFRGNQPHQNFAAFTAACSGYCGWRRNPSSLTAV